MSSDPPAVSVSRLKPRLVRLFRWSAWVLLIGATGYLVRAEVKRPDLPEGVRAFPDLVYRQASDRRLRLDVYVPESPAPPSGRPAVLAIHGGGWRGGSKEGYGRSAARLAQQGLVVVAVDYTLSRPGAPSWPENLDDVREAVRWMRRHHKTYGIDPNRIAAMGESAGGHLAALLGTIPADPEARVQAVIDFYGPADLAALVTSRPPTADPVGLFLGGTLASTPERYQAASPARHVTRDTVPMLILHGTEDVLVPLSQSQALDSALERAGVPHRLIVVAGARHGFSFRIDDRRDLLPEVLAFLQGVWNASVAQPPASP